MRRIALWSAAAAIAAAAVVLWIKLRAGPESTEGAAPAPGPAPEAPRVDADRSPRRAPPPPPEIAAERRPPIPARPADEAVKPRATSTAETGDSGDAAEVVREASNAYANERYREALEHAENALELDGSSALARSLAVLSACGLGRGDRAVEHAARLDERRIQPLVSRCHIEYGIELEIPPAAKRP